MYSSNDFDFRQTTRVASWYVKMLLGAIAILLGAAAMDTIESSIMVNRSPKSVILHIGHLIGSNIAAWCDF